MRKLAVLAMMIAIAMALPATMASADDYHHWWGFHGTYAMTGAGSSLWDPAGFQANLVVKPLPDGTYVTYGSHFTLRGIWEFGGNGTGRTTFTRFGITPPATTLPHGGLPNAASLEFSFDFTYTVTEDGLLTVEMLPGTFEGNYRTGPNANLDPPRTFTIDKATFSGWVSKDRKTLTLNADNELQYFTVYQGSALFAQCFAISNTGAILIRVKEVDD